MSQQNADMAAIANLVLIQGIIIERLVERTGVMSTALDGLPDATERVEGILSDNQSLI